MNIPPSEPGPSEPGPNEVKQNNEAFVATARKMRATANILSALEELEDRTTRVQIVVGILALLDDKVSDMLEGAILERAKRSRL